MLLRLTARLWGSHIHLRYSTSATCFRFPQLLYDRTQAPTQLVIHNFCYRIDIHVDTRGVASPVSEQSSGFLDDPPGYTASLRRLLTKIYFLGTEGGRTLPPRSTDLLTTHVVTRVSRGFLLALHDTPCTTLANKDLLALCRGRQNSTPSFDRIPHQREHATRVSRGFSLRYTIFRMRSISKKSSGEMPVLFTTDGSNWLYRRKLNGSMCSEAETEEKNDHTRPVPPLSFS